MDSSTRQLVELALDTTYGTLSAETVHEAKRRLIDTFGCAMGSYDHPLSASMRDLASQYRPGGESAGVWGSAVRTTPDLAAFANGVMLRVGENSDTFIGAGGGGHPSDMIAAMVAAAESARADGRALVAATVVGYDAYCRMMELTNLGSKGIDQAVHVALGAVLGAGKLMGLSREQLGHAVSLAITSNVALRQTRHGQLSSWKGCAGANASRNAVFAATLAKHGVEGPAEPFEGKQGLWFLGGRFEWPPLPELRATRMITRTSIKPLPVCYHTQAGALAALEARKRLQVGQIAEVHVETYQVGFEMAAGEPGQWKPRTSESADHSLPFVVATALAHGSVEPGMFAVERLGDPEVVELVKKVKVTVDPKLSSMWPVTAPGRVTVRTSSGTVATEILYPRGHVRNPMTDAELGAKFTAMVGARMSPGASERALSALWSVDAAKDLGPEVLAPLVR